MTQVIIEGTISQYFEDDSVEFAGTVTLEIFAEDANWDYRYISPQFEDIAVELAADEYFLLSLDGARWDEIALARVDFKSGAFGTYLSFYDEQNDREYLFEMSRSDNRVPDLPQSTAQIENFVRLSETIGFLTDDPNLTESLDISSWQGATVTEDDVLNLTPADGLAQFDTGFGDDTVYALGDFYNISGGVGNDRLVVHGDQDGFASTARLDGGDDHDILKIKFDLHGEMKGDAGNDKLIGANLSDELDGGTGRDILIGLDGDDDLTGGGSRDFLYGGKGEDVVFGERGDDELRGNRGNDSLYGDLGSDDLRGGGNDDMLWGGDGDDFLFGENGRDTLHGGSGDDVLTGGRGGDLGDGLRDVFVYENAFAFAGYDRVKDFENGIDQLDLSLSNVIDFADVYSRAADTDTGLRIRFDPGEVVFLEGFTKAEFDITDVIL